MSYQDPQQNPYGGQPQQPQQPYGQQNPYGTPQAGGIDPGDGLGKVGKILSIIPCTTGIGFILNLVAYFQSKNAGFQNQHTKIGFIFNAIWVGLEIIFYIIYAVVLATSMN